MDPRQRSAGMTTKDNVCLEIEDGPLIPQKGGARCGLERVRGFGPSRAEGRAGRRPPLIPPEMKAGLDLGTFLEEPAQGRAEDGEKQGAGDGPGVALNHEVLNDVARGKENGGVEQDREEAQREDVQGQR